MCEYFNFCFGPPVVIRTVLEPITQLNASVLCYLIVAIGTSKIATPSGSRDAQILIYSILWAITPLAISLI